MIDDMVISFETYLRSVFFTSVTLTGGSFFSITLHMHSNVPKDIQIADDWYTPYTYYLINA